MKLLVLDVRSCGDCPLLRTHRGHGEGFDYCSHKDHGRKGYEDIIHNKALIPDWCPLPNMESKSARG